MATTTLTHELSGTLRPNRPVGRAVVGGIAVVQLAALLALWTGTRGEVLPGPREVLGALASLWLDHGLGRELIHSATSSIEAVALSALLALPLAWSTVLPMMRPIVGFIAKGRFLGLVGLTFVFMLATGGGHALKLSVLTFGMGVFLVTGMADAVAQIPRAKFDHARSLRFSDWRTVWEVVVLGTADQALELVRQNAAMGWAMVTLVEGLNRTEGGVGALLLDQNKHFHLAEVFAIQLCVLLVGLLQDAALAGLRRALCPWSELGRERRS